MEKILRKVKCSERLPLEQSSSLEPEKYGISNEQKLIKTLQIAAGLEDIT